MLKDYASKLRLSKLPYLIFALLLYLSWVWPGSLAGAIFAILTAIVIAWLCASPYKLSIKNCYISGIIVNILGFYWLAQTIEKFGGFSPVVSWVIFGFFVVVSSIQFLFFAFLFNRLPNYFGCFRLALAWVSAEFLFPRIFPWELSHPVIGIPELAQISDIAGTPLIAFLLLTNSALLISVFSIKKGFSRSLPAITLAIVLPLWFAYGRISLSKYSSDIPHPLKVAIIQANVAVIEQGDMSAIRQNKQRYLDLSKEISSDTDLLIWPESIIQDWVWVDTKNINQDPRLPFFGPQTSLLSGALTFRSQEKIYNSALLIRNDGEILPPYHKRILMPFGEYMPFSDIFPWLNSINANLALFTAGTAPSVFEVPAKNQAHSNTKISPLICYEDLIPRLARSSTQNGAQILINLTNDAWFGTGPAAAHHNLIASYRAIENRRYLIRSTNNGYTAVVDPTGKTIGTILPNSEGILETLIEPKNTSTLFTQYFGPCIWWMISITVALLAALSRLRRKN